MSLSLCGQPPEPLDLAAIATPAETIASVIEELGRAGGSAAIVVSGGFAEISRADPEGELLKAAKRHGVRILWLNRVGVLSKYRARRYFYPQLAPLGRTQLPARRKTRLWA